jgi:hypothetical protein
MGPFKKIKRMAIIKLAYKQLIDAHSATPFEQKVFHATYSEFLVQQQSFSKGKELHSWEAIRSTFPKSDPALPFKVSFSIAGVIGSLDHRIPGLEDALGDCSIPFSRYRFSLIAADAKDPSLHKISLTWFTEELTLLAIIGNQLLLSQTPPHTTQLKMQPGLSVVHYMSTRQSDPKSLLSASTLPSSL